MDYNYYYIHNLSTVLQFQFNPFAILSSLAAILNIILFIIILRQPIKTTMHVYSGLLNLFAAIWAFFDTLLRISATPDGAAFWNSFATLGWAFLPALLIGFSLSHAEKDKMLKSWFVNALLYTPSFIFLLISLTTDLIDIHQYKPIYYGWINPVGPLFTFLVAPWIFISTLVAFTILFKYRASLQDSVRKRQTTVLIIALLIPFVSVTTTEIIFPIFGLMNISKFGVIFTSLTCVIFTYDMLKYKLFIINPATIISNIVDTMHEVLIVFSAVDHKIEFVNNAIAKVLGYPKSALVGQNLENLITKDNTKFTNQVLLPVIQGNEISSIETELLSASGEKIPVNFSASPYRTPDGAIQSIISVATDIRQLKQLLDVAAEQNKLHVTIESISDGVLALDLSGKVIMVNSSATTILGFSNQEFLLNKKLDDIVKMSSNDEIVTTANFLPQQQITEEMVIVFKNEVKMEYDNKTIFVSLISSAIKEGAQVGLGAIVTLHDLSAEHELEEMKLDFVSMAAHELRTPLTSLRGYTYLLTRDYQNKFDQNANTIIQRIDISTKRLVGLIENLLNVTRVERGTLTVNIQPIDWVANIKDVINEIIDQANDKHITITFTPPTKPLPPIGVDKIRINEVLTNLIINGVNYTEPGGSITIWIEITEKEVITHIKDTGEGIPANAIPHLFTKFFRVSGRLEMGSKGTGLGLYISKSIVEMHQGRIWAKSEGLGKGATFSFTLPLAQKVISPSQQGVILENTLKK